MLTHEYETVVIFRPDLDDADTRENIDKLEAIITDNDGTMLIKDEWGKRKLAYPIANHLKGHYVLYNFLGPATSIDEIERRIRINDKIIRFMTVKLDEDVDIPTKIANAAEERARREEEARIRAAQEAERLANEEAAQHGYLDDDDKDDKSSDDDDDDDEEVMRVILKSEVPNLGDAGDIVKVAPGFGRNYLMPRGLAIPASEGSIRELEHQKRMAEAIRRKQLAGAQDIASRLENSAVSIRREAGDDDRLFGSVTNRDIAEALAAEGVEIDRRSIQLDEPIRNIGLFTVPIRLHRKVTASVRVYVIRA